ncbi:MAG: hypothetical protein ACOYYS_01930 [Chloroflexota bacterium]
MTKHRLRLLTEEERMTLEIQFLNTPDPAESFSASGEHYRLGYHPYSREDAYHGIGFFSQRHLA